MFDCTFVSSDPDKYYEVECPVNYLGVSTQLKWYVSSINTMFSVVMFGPDDYIEYTLGRGDVAERNKIQLLRYYKSFDEGVLEDLNNGFKMAEQEITIGTDDLGKVKINNIYPYVVFASIFNLAKTYIGGQRPNLKILPRKNAILNWC